MSKTDKAIISTSSGPTPPALIYLAGLPKESSRINQRYDMDALARKLGMMKAFDFACPASDDGYRTVDAFSFRWELLRYEHMTIIQTSLLENYKPRTAARIMCAVKGTLKAARKMRLMDAESYELAIDLPTIKRGKSITGRALTVEEIAALLKTCRNGPPLRGTRDAAIIILMAGCGLRENEVTHLSLSDYNPTSGDLLVHGKGGGKGGKLRPAYLTNGTKRAMDDWLTLRGSEPGALFGVISKADETTVSNMSNISVWQMLKRRAGLAGLQPFTPHDLRRTFISDMLNLTDLATVARLAGHEDVATTAGYDRRPLQHTIDAAALLSIPFTPRGEL